MTSTVGSVICLLFFTQDAPLAQLLVKMGGTTSPVPYGVGATADRDCLYCCTLLVCDAYYLCHCLVITELLNVHINTFVCYLN